MMHKRPFVDEDSHDITSKQPRLQEHASQVAHTIDADMVSSINASEKPQTDGEGAKFAKSQDEGRLLNDSVTEVSNETMVLESGVSGSISNFLWVNERIIGADVRSEAVAHSSFFPEFFQPGHHLKALYHSDELYSSLFNCPPTKLVSVGPQHQAFVPEWGGLQPLNNCSDLDKSDPQVAMSHASDGGLYIDDINEMLMGKCVIPMPDLEASANSCYGSGQTRHDCTCLDEGSVRCVRQHVTEAREKLRENLGHEIFEKLGFGEMGEEVAKKWTLEEERAFHEVVISNPASLDKNFWDHLWAVFPSRTKKDLVCYYFNVFILRKRAEQNRFDPLNIDSDNDEWLRSELEPLEDDEDSVVESSFDQDAAVYYQVDHIDFLEDIEVGEEVNDCENGTDIVSCRVGFDKEDEGDIDDISGTCVNNSVGDCHGNVDLELCGKIPISNGEDDVQEDSCTSYECQQDRVDTCGPPDARIDARESSEE